MTEREELLRNLQNARRYALKGDDINLNYYLADDFDENYYGEVTLKFGSLHAELESIWTDVGNIVMLHVCCKSFEGDIRIDSISKQNQTRVIDMLITKFSNN